MIEQEIYEKNLEIIQEVGWKESQVSQTLSLKDDLEGRSVDFMEFILTVEDEFGIEISDEDIDELKNVSDIVVWVQKILKKA